MKHGKASKNIGKPKDSKAKQGKAVSARETRGTQANLGFAGESRGKQGKAREWDDAGAAGKHAKAGENKESKGTQRKGEESRRK